MKCFIIALLLIVNSSVAQIENPQGQIQSGLTEGELKIAVDTYLKMTQTEIYIAHKKAQSEIIKKLNILIIPKELINEDQWKKWITDNLPKTQFNNVEEAVNLRKQDLVLTAKLIKDNHNLFEWIEKATTKQKMEILRPEKKQH